MKMETERTTDNHMCVQKQGKTQTTTHIHTSTCTTTITSHQNRLCGPHLRGKPAGGNKLVSPPPTGYTSLGPAEWPPQHKGVLIYGLARPIDERGVVWLATKAVNCTCSPPSDFMAYKYSLACKQAKTIIFKFPNARPNARPIGCTHARTHAHAHTQTHTRTHAHTQSPETFGGPPCVDMHNSPSAYKWQSLFGWKCGCQLH